MRGIIISFLVVFLGGCATHQQNIDGNNPSQDSNNRKHFIYGKLENNSEGYAFTQFSESYVKAEPWVRLPDMKPMWNTQKEDCLTGIVEITNKDVTCKTGDERLFRTKGTDFTAKKTTGYVFLSALSFGLWATMPPGAVEFDRNDYQSSVKEAEKKLIDAYKTFGQGYLKYLNEYDNDMRDFNELYDNIVSGYKSNVIPKINIRDDSGIFDGDASSFRNKISVSKNNIISRNGFDRVEAKTIDNLVLLAKDRNSTATEKLRTATSALSVTCNNRKFSNFNYIIKCPEVVDSSSTEFRVDVVIESFSYRNVLPKYISEEDEFVSLILKDGGFYLTNKTKSYITVDSLSFYHNGKIATSSKIGGELAPLSEAQLVSLNRLPVDQNAIAFNNVTKADALRTKIEYGVAVKYRIVNTNRENTLFKTSEYLLYDLI